MQPRHPRPGGGGGEGQHPAPIHTHSPQFKGRKEWGHRGSVACLRVNCPPKSSGAVVRQSGTAPI